MKNKKKKTIGFLARGEDANLINNSFSGLDVGIQDEGKRTFATGNKFNSMPDQEYKESEKKEIIKLSPEFCGVGVNLKALWKKIKTFFKSG